MKKVLFSLLLLLSTSAFAERWIMFDDIIGIPNLTKVSEPTVLALMLVGLMGMTKWRAQK